MSTKRIHEYRRRRDPGKLSNKYCYTVHARGAATPKALRRCQVVEMCEDEELRFYIARNFCKMW